MRHRLNLTVRGNVYVRRVLFDGNKAIGVEAESGGETFTVEADRVVLCSGALRSPQLLLLSPASARPTNSRSSAFRKCMNLPASARACGTT